MKNYSRKLDGFERFIGETSKEFNIPGCSIAIVEGSNVVYSGSYGYRDIKRNLKVDENTLFPIGSITKTFTAMSLGILADSGKLDWDKPVINYLPDFRMYDAYVNERITPKDLLSHRSGLPGHDFTWYGSNMSREKLLEKTRFMEPNTDLRTKWQYNNVMFGIAGILLEKISGLSCEDFIRENILKPLDMSSTNFSLADTFKTTNYSMPYTYFGEITENPFQIVDAAMGPAGFINSNITDMLKFVKLNLNLGEYNGKRIISEQNIKEMYKPQIANADVIPLKYNEHSHTSYGLGLWVDNYRGFKLLYHGGHTAGFYAIAGFVPEKEIGFVILNNLNDGITLLVSAMYTILDRMLGLEPVDWNSRLKKEVIEKAIIASQQQSKAMDDAKIKNTVPSHSLEDYTGVYEHPAYPKLSIILKNNELELDFAGQKVCLQHYHYDIFTAILDMEGDKKTYFISFITEKDGKVKRIEINLEPKGRDIMFRKG